MKPTLRVVSLLVPLAVLLAAGSALAAGATVKVEKKEGVGSYLADGKGKTLYTFKKDTPNTSTCEGGCAGKWPAFYEAKVEPEGGLEAADFGTITRPDGKKQTTYKGMPLYYFVGDKKGGETAGQGFRGFWFAATP